MSFFDKIKKGIKKGVGKITKGVKRAVSKVGKGLKKAGFNKNFGRDFMKGLAMTGKALQQPEKFIRKIDPLAKKMGPLGFLSPISLAGSILTAPLTSIGVFEELAGSREKQKKLASGDIDTITDVALAPLGLIPFGGGATAAKSVAKSGVKAGVKSGGKKVIKNLGKGTAKLIRKRF